MAPRRHPEVFDQTLAALRDTRPGFLHALSQGACHSDVGAPTIEWMWQIFMQASPGADAALAALGELDQSALLARVSVPALVAHGVHDQIVPYDIGVEAAKMLPNARLVEFDSSGHAPFLDETAKYRQELLGFLNDLD